MRAAGVAAEEEQQGQIEVDSLVRGHMCVLCSTASPIRCCVYEQGIWHKREFATCPGHCLLPWPADLRRPLLLVLPQRWEQQGCWLQDPAHQAWSTSRACGDGLSRLRSSWQAQGTQAQVWGSERRQPSIGCWWSALEDLKL